MKWLGALLAVLSIEAQVFAGGCRSFSYGHSASYAPSYSYPTYVEKVIRIVEYVPFIAYAPVGFATYVPAPAVPVTPLAAIAPVAPAVAPVLASPIVQVPAVAVADPCAARMAAVQADLAALRSEMATMRQNQPPLLKTPAPATEPVPAPKADAPQAKAAVSGLGVLNLKCARCHEGAVAAKLGGDLVLFQGARPAPLSDAQMVAVFKNVLRGTMPPAKEGKLSEQEGQAILEYLDQLQAKK